MPPSMQDKLAQRFAHIPASDAMRIIMLELSKIVPNPNQPRKNFDEASIEELANSIKTHGLIQPITVKSNGDDTFILVAGERRFRAHKHLEKTHIYAIVTDGNPDEISLIENIHREDLHPLELAESFQGLLDKYNWNQEQLGQAIGKNRRTVNELLQLLKLPEDIRDECRALGTDISKIALLQLVRIPAADHRRQMWLQIKGGNLTTREIQAKKKSVTVPSDPLSPARQVVASGKGFVKRLQAINPTDLSEEDYYQLLEIRQDITALFSAIEANRAQ